MKKSIVLELPPGENNPRNSEGSFVKLGDGRLMFIYSRYTGDNWQDDAAADLAVRYSRDDGRSWDEADTIIRHRGNALNLMSSSLLRLASGRLLLVFLEKLLHAEHGVDCLVKICHSDDDGVTWSEARDVVPFGGYHVVNNDRIIQLPSGRIIVPVAYHRPCGDRRHDARSMVLLYLSDDDGETFSEGGEWILPPQKSQSGLQEPGVVSLGGDLVWSWSRTDQGSQYGSWSQDGGESWTEAAGMRDFISPLSPMSVKRNEYDNRLYAIWNDRSARSGELGNPRDSSWGRTPLTLAWSGDGGKSWEGHIGLEVDTESGYCYTAMFFASRKELLLGYCCGGRDVAVLQKLRIMRVEL